MNKNEMQLLIDTADETRRQIKNAVKECLLKIGKPVEFDWEGNTAPSYASQAFEDDMSDVYITKIWCENDLIKVNIHAYYLGEDKQNIDLISECYADWEEILACLIGKLD